MHKETIRAWQENNESLLSTLKHIVARDAERGINTIMLFQIIADGGKEHFLDIYGLIAALEITTKVDYSKSREG